MVKDVGNHYGRSRVFVEESMCSEAVIDPGWKNCLQDYMRRLDASWVDRYNAVSKVAKTAPYMDHGSTRWRPW